MKILDLKFQAFGPFLNVQHIPFSELNDKGMFLINGPTGMGKTSIFDAIVYALYGRASGEDRDDSKSLRSDFATDNIETFVELVFEANGKQYKIIRKPAYERKAKKGNGVTTEQASVELYLPDGGVLTKQKEVDDKLVNDILFINRAQFKNIALLAQGEFTKLITASTKERAEILEHIFSKEIYNEFQNRISEYSKEIYKQVSSSITTCQTLLNQIEDGENILGYSQAFEDPNNIPDFLIHLNELIIKLEGELKERNAVVESLRKEYEKASSALTTLKQNNQIVNAYLEAVNKLDSLSKEKEKYIELEKQIDVINEHTLLTPLFKQLEVAKNNHIGDAAMLFEAEKKLEQLTPEEEWLKENLDKYNKQKEEINNLSNRLKNLKSVYTQIQALVIEKNNVDRLDAEFAKHYQEFKTKETHYQEVREKFFASTSYNLAKDLLEGTPCPVCGSIHHPSLAHITDPVSEADFKKVEADYNETNKKINEEKNNIDAKRSSLSSKEETMIILLKENGFKDASTKLIYSDEFKNIIKDAESELAEITKFVTSYENRQKKYSDCVTSYKQTIVSKSELVESHKKNIASIQESINKTLSSNKIIKTEEDYKNLKVTMSIQDIKNKVEAYKQECIKADAIIKNTPKALIEAGQINESELVTSVNEKKKVFEDYLNGNNALDNKIKNLNKMYKSIEEAYLKSKDIITRYSSINEVSNIANGSNRKRLSFKMYILADYFDKIIHQANRRLNKMTNGRYQLIRRDETKGGRGFAGLDLDVYDIETGKNRAASTLSGGEKFVSALSMALGLSDIIETNQALIQVESIFIDEGFGTLDEDYLDMAMTALESLKDDNKTVAIISHVEKLKDYIPDGIEVEKDTTGSKITIKNRL